MMPRVNVDGPRSDARLFSETAGETPDGARAPLSAPERRIKLMLTIDGLGLGGAEMVVRDLARHLDRDWFDVCICCTKGIGGTVGETLLSEGYDLFVLPGQRHGRVDYWSSLKLRRAIRQREVDIVHTHATSALFDAGLCKLTLPRVKVVHTFHYGNYPYESWRRHILEGLLSRVFDRLVAVGWEQRRQIQATYKLSNGGFDTIWNGIVPVPPAAPPDEFRSNVGTGDRLLVGTVAKLIHQKGLDHLLRVARKCVDAGRRMHFVIVGGGPLREALEQQIRELDLVDTVTLTGWIPDAAARAVPAFDVFFQPSRWEAMSIATIEAMASGKPTVATRVGDNPHVLVDGKSGLLVEPGDIDAMVAALCRMDDAGLREQMGRAAREDFERRFAIEHMIRGYERVYRELAGFRFADAHAPSPISKRP
jgi:glycosyltransferase involved in cell wall biosynthesis